MDWEDAAPHLLSENGPEWTASGPSYEVPLNLVPYILHRNERSCDVSSSGGPHARLSYVLLELCTSWCCSSLGPRGRS